MYQMMETDIYEKETPITCQTISKKNVKQFEFNIQNMWCSLTHQNVFSFLNGTKCSIY